MRPTLRQLEYIIAVAETGHIGQAAKRLNVSQPSLSVQLADAEAELGTTLFQRSRAGCWPTAAGEEVVKRARFILDAVSRLKENARGDDLFSGRLRLGVLPSVGPYLLPPVVAKLHREKPEFKISIREESTKELDSGLRDGRLDMIISSPEDHPGLRETPLFRETLWTGFAPDHPLSETSGALSLSDLRGEVLLTIGQRYRLSHIVIGLAQAAGARVVDDYEGTSLDAIRLMASSGAGVAILPEIYAKTEAQRGMDLTLRKLNDPKAHRNISLFAQSSFSDADVAAFAHALKENATAILD
ncbi:MAG: hydrogen peroxide-inducible genes activator [Pseudomonadota bacterium]